MKITNIELNQTLAILGIKMFVTFERDSEVLEVLCIKRDNEWDSQQPTCAADMDSTREYLSSEEQTIAYAACEAAL